MKSKQQQFFLYSNQPWTVEPLMGAALLRKVRNPTLTLNRVKIPFINSLPQIPQYLAACDIGLDKLSMFWKWLLHEAYPLVFTETAMTMFSWQYDKKGILHFKRVGRFQNGCHVRQWHITGPRQLLDPFRQPRDHKLSSSVLTVWKVSESWIEPPWKQQQTSKGGRVWL